MGGKEWAVGRLFFISIMIALHTLPFYIGGMVGTTKGGTIQDREMATTRGYGRGMGVWAAGRSNGLWNIIK